MKTIHLFVSMFVAFTELLDEYSFRLLRFHIDAKFNTIHFRLQGNLMLCINFY